ncbi:MAG: hypothetical protein ACYTX0_38050 [Nostoc sp.]
MSSLSEGYFLVTIPPLQNCTLLYETLRVACFHEVVRRSSGHRFRLPTSNFFNKHFWNPV